MKRINGSGSCGENVSTDLVVFESNIDKDQRASESDADLIRLPELITMTGFEKSWLYALMQETGEYFDPTFPKRRRSGIRAVAWVRGEVKVWSASKPEIHVSAASTLKTPSKTLSRPTVNAQSKAREEGTAQHPVILQQIDTNSSSPTIARAPTLAKLQSVGDNLRSETLSGKSGAAVQTETYAQLPGQHDKESMRLNGSAPRVKHPVTSSHDFLRMCDEVERRRLAEKRAKLATKTNEPCLNGEIRSAGESS